MGYHHLLKWSSDDADGGGVWSDIQFNDKHHPQATAVLSSIDQTLIICCRSPVDIK